MSSYDDRARRYHEPRESRYVETHEYRPTQGQELVTHDLPVEPYYSDRDVRRARSAAPYYEEEDYYASRYVNPRDYHRDRGSDRHRHRKNSSKPYMEEERARRRMLSKEQKIMAALAGAALLAGGKELYDRHDAKEKEVNIQRNPLASAAFGAAGALAGYQGAEMYGKQASKQKSKHVVRGRDGRIEEENWTDDSSDDEKERKHNSSFLKNAIAAAGLGKMVKSIAGGGDDRSERSHRSRSTRARSNSSSSSRSRSRHESATEKIQKAAVASLLAGASEAFRVSKQPGSWKGEKTKRILTAAMTAGGIDAAHDTKHTKAGLLEAVMGGLVANRAIHGSKKDIVEDRYGRSRSRSRARSQSSKHGSSAGGPAAAILGAIAGKKLLDHHSSRSRSRGRREDSVGSYDSQRSNKKGVRERSRSAVRKLLAKTGLDDDTDKYDDDHKDDYYYEDERPRRSRRQRDYDSRSRSRSRSVTRRSRDVPRGGEKGEVVGGYSSDSELGNSDDDAKHYKKMRGKSVVSGGLAAVATIHAAHGVYESYEKRQRRRRAVREGKLSEAEAGRLRKKALLQDVASVGIAALGVKGAVSELKGAKELNHECKELKHEQRFRHEKRVNKKHRLQDVEDDTGGWYSGGDEFYYADDGHKRLWSSSHRPQAPVGGGYRSS